PPDRNSHESHRDRIGWGARPPRAQPTTPSSLASRRARANRFACPPGQMFGARARRTAAEAAALPVIPHSAFRIHMIPREILKKIRQIEIRTNRTVTELAGERARLGRSQRRPRRWPRVARVQTDSLVPPAKFSAAGRAEPQPRRLRSP